MQHLATYNAQDLAHGSSSNMPVHNTTLIQKADGIAHTALRLDSNKAQRLWLNLQVTALGNLRQVLCNIIHRNPAELKALTARLNGSRHLLRVCGCQNKDSVLRRLL